MKEILAACLLSLTGLAWAEADIPSPAETFDHPVGADRTLAPYPKVRDYLRTLLVSASTSPAVLLSLLKAVSVVNSRAFTPEILDCRIIPAAGRMPDAKERFAFADARTLTPTRFQAVVGRVLESSAIRPGEEYIAWFAVAGDKPRDFNSSYRSANGLGLDVDVAVSVAPRIIPLSVRLHCLGSLTRIGPLPERHRSRPIPMYLHNAALDLNRHGVSTWV